MQRKITKQRRGASLTEYGIVTGLISVLSIGAVLGLGEEIRDAFTDARTELAARTPAGGGSGSGGAPSAGDPVGGGPVVTAPEEDPDVLPFVRAAGNTVILNSVTQLTAEISALSEVGDTLVAFVVHRSALTVPSGWSVEGTQKNGTFDQWLTILTKPYADTDPGTVTFSQASSNRMLAQVLTVAGTNPQVATFSSNNGSSPDYAGPSYVVAGAQSLTLAARGEVFGGTNVTVPNGWTMTTPTSIADNRLAVAWKIEDAGAIGTIVQGPAFPDDSSSHLWANTVVQITTDGIAAAYSEDLGVYTTYIDPLTFLMLTDGNDNATLTGQPGVYAKAGNDTINGTSAAEIFIGAPGNDNIQGGSGNDTYVFAAGDGQDIIRDTGGTDVIVFPNYTLADATLRGVDQGTDMRINLPAGDQITVDLGFYSSGNAIDQLQFADGATLTMQQMIDKAADDGKTFGTVQGSRMNDNHFHAQSIDGSYVIDEAGGTDVLEFTETASTAVSFSVDSLGYDLIITTPDGDTVTIDTQLFSTSNGSIIETISFSDGVSLNQAQQQVRALQDQKATGTVHGTNLNDAFIHTSSQDGSYVITGNLVGNDSLTFTDFAFADASVYTFGGTGANDIMIMAPDGDLVRINSYRSLASPWLDSVVFTDGPRTRAELLAVATEWGGLPAPG